MSLENGNQPEKIEIPKTPEEMIEKYLSFPTVEKRHFRLRVDNALKNENTVKYANALLAAAHQEGMEYIVDQADSLKKKMHEYAEQLKLPTTKWSKDVSWAMHELGKQYHHYLHADEPSDIPKDERIDPFSGTEEANPILWKIIDRGLAAEARKAFFSKGYKEKEWTAAVKADSTRFKDALPILSDKKQKNNGHLTYEELTRLGKILEEIVDGTNSSKTESNKQTVQSEEADLAKTLAELRDWLKEDANKANRTQSQLPSVEGAPSIVPQVREEGAGLITESELAELIRVDHQHTVGKEMRDSLRSLGPSRTETRNPPNAQETPATGSRQNETAGGGRGGGNENTPGGHGGGNENTPGGHGAEAHGEGHSGEGGHDDHGHDGHGHAKRAPLTLKGFLKGAATAAWYIPISAAYVASKEFLKTTWESLKGAFGVLKKWWDSWFSIGFLNKSVEGGGGGGHKKEEHKADHGADAHGGDHGKKKDDHGHGGGGHH